MGVVDVVAFGIGPGSLIFGIQMIWIPFWAAGVINGVGHYWGYRNFPVEDASTNIVPWGILIGGEEFHNNHHAYPTSAKLSSVWYEFDIGWMYIRILETLGLARVRRIAPTPRYSPGKTACDADTVKAIVTRRYHVLAQYHRSVRDACRQEIRTLRRRRRDAERRRHRRTLGAEPASLAALAYVGLAGASPDDSRLAGAQA